VKHQIRTYRPGDLSGLTKFLNSNFDYDILNEKLLDEKLAEDPNWEPEKALICHDGEKIIGFVQGVIRDIQGTRFGYIKLMAVDKSNRRQGIARALYEQLECSFISDKVNVIRIYDVPKNYFMPGIDPRYIEAVCFAIRMGFKRFGDATNLIVDLNESVWNTTREENMLKIHGIEVKRAEVKEKKNVMDFVKDEWALWIHEIEMAFRDDPPSIHVAHLHGEIKAFSAHNGNNKGTGWFGPMGTHPELRGKSIGSILLKRCLKDMKQMGQKRAIIPWIDHIDFYVHHANARVDRVFWRYEKLLK
jgi:ribosomal protein S18 acetylase RimI-like enzyme